MASTTAATPPILPISVQSSNAPSASASPFSLFLTRLTGSLRRTYTFARPWPELVDPSAFTPRPDSLPAAILRLRRNLSYFKLNYSLLLLLSLTLSLLSHPFSLILLLSLLGAWAFLYLFRAADSPPVVILGRQFSDRETLLILSGLSFFLVFFTSLGSLIIYSLTVGSVIVCVHGALRVPEDLFLDEQEGVASGGAGGGAAAGLFSFLGNAAASAGVNSGSRV
ncbi:hypothetical protein LUZ60_003873 [Juncus effusus]|nr:hypothetical protein LUZ60_003873 [Juncus effusus]